MKKKIVPFINRRYVHTFGASGDFTASEHLNFLLKAEEKWADGKYTDDLVPHVDALLKQLNGQTARFEELDNPSKDNVVNLTWIKSCGMDTTDLDRSTDICTIEGGELQTTSQEYEMTMGQKFNFSVDAEKIRTGTYEMDEQVAHGMLRLDKQLSEWWTKKLLVFYKANAGVNVPVAGGVAVPFTWDAGNETANIPYANYTTKIMASLIRQQILNMVNSGWYINSGGLFEEWKNAGLDSGNLDGKGDDLRTKQIDLTFDMWNFAKAGLTEDMFLISANAVALKTYTRYTDKPEIVGGKINETRYRMKSNILPGVYWDMIYQLTCVAGHDIHAWQGMTAGDIFLNPEPCPQTVSIAGVPTEVTPTGIYSYTPIA